MVAQLLPEWWLNPKRNGGSTWPDSVLKQPRNIHELLQSTDVIAEQSSFLFDKALDAGGKDNLSFILIKLKSVT